MLWLTILTLLSCKRYDYEEVDGDRAGEMIESLRKLVSTDLDKLRSIDNSKHGDGFSIVGGDDFLYEDPIDFSISKKQVQCKNDAVENVSSQIGWQESPILITHILLASHLNRASASFLRMAPD